jgi:V8-like Glu-specific endopeptidase
MITQIRRPPARRVAAVCAAALACAATAVAQDETRELSTAARDLASSASTISCVFDDDPKISDCVSTNLPAIRWRTDYHTALSATFSVQVSYSGVKNSDNSPRVSRGTAFLVDRGKRYLVTAKHVILGENMDWPSRLQSSGFSNIEDAVLDYLRQPANAEIQIRPAGYTNGIRVILVALDPNSDLALLQAASFDELLIASRPFFRQLPFMNEYKCDKANQPVFAVGYIAPPPAAAAVSRPETASCNIQPKTAYIGGMKYNFSLYDTKSDFEPGMSGGPVLDDKTVQVVGVVSGATVGSSRKFFTPLPSLKAFLSRF